MASVTDLTRIFGKGGILSKTLPNYEYRPQQLRIAKSVEGALMGGQVFMLESECGSGKSLSYLIPLLRWLDEDIKRRAIVSTFTKTLQQQLIDKDIPLSLKILDLPYPFNYKVAYGARNYLCRKRLAFLRQQREYVVEDPKLLKELDRVHRWSLETDTGLLTELDPPITKSIAQHICRDTKTFCKANDCPDGPCFAVKAREELNRSGLIVVNHSILCVDLLSGFKYLPHWDAAIIDEAHAIESSYTSFFTAQVSPERVFRLLSDISHPTKEKGLLHLLYPSQIHGSKAHFKLYDTLVSQARDSAHHFFQALSHDGRSPASSRPAAEGLTSSLGALFAHLRDIPNQVSVSGDISDSLISLSSIYEDIVSDINSCYRSDSPENAVSIEQTQRKDRYPILKMQPVEASGFFESLLDPAYTPKPRPFCFISGALTLPEGGKPSFEYMSKKLGLNPDKSEHIPGTYDYAGRTALFIDEAAPDPQREADRYVENLVYRIRSIAEASSGRALALFTNYNVMNSVAERLRNSAMPFPILVQGELENYYIVTSMKNDPRQIILGTTSFSIGIDIPGLRALIITKLPFGVPDDPVYLAKSSILRARGQDPFLDFLLPETILMLKQGYGRLVRGLSDWGGIAILDPRLAEGKRSYGNRILESLPLSRRIDAFDDFLAFLRQREPGQARKSTKARR